MYCMGCMEWRGKRRRGIFLGFFYGESRVSYPK